MRILNFYKEVGCIWGWTGRLLKSREELVEILNSVHNEVGSSKLKMKLPDFSNWNDLPRKQKGLSWLETRLAWKRTRAKTDSGSHCQSRTKR